MSGDVVGADGDTGTEGATLVETGSAVVVEEVTVSGRGGHIFVSGLFLIYLLVWIKFLI